MTVYLLMLGRYSDRRVIGGYHSQAEAERLAGEIRGDVEEVVLDHPPAGLLAGMHLYRVEMTGEGAVTALRRADEDDAQYFIQDPEYVWQTYGKPEGSGPLVSIIAARDEAHAVKIMSERRVRYLAHREVMERAAVEARCQKMALGHFERYKAKHDESDP